MKSLDEQLFEALRRTRRQLRPRGPRPEEMPAPPEGMPPFPEEEEHCGCGHGRGHDRGPGDMSCERHMHGPEDRECGHRGPGPEDRECGRHMHGPEEMPPHECRRHGPDDGPRGPRPHRGPMAREHILEILNDAPAGMHQKEIAQQMGVNASSMSEFLDRLEDGGYIQRIPDPSDKRATLISLTEKGQSRAAELEDERSAQFADLFGNLTDEEKKTLIDLLNKISPED